MCEEDWEKKGRREDAEEMEAGVKKELLVFKTNPIWSSAPSFLHYSLF